MQFDSANLASHSVTHHKFIPCSWEEVYQAAVLETDDALLEQCIEVAEQALLTRWLEMTNRHKHNVEIQAIVNAVKALQVLKRERLRLERKPSRQASNLTRSSSALRSSWDSSRNFSLSVSLANSWAICRHRLLDFCLGI